MWRGRGADFVFLMYSMYDLYFNSYKYDVSVAQTIVSPPWFGVEGNVKIIGKNLFAQYFELIEKIVCEHIISSPVLTLSIFTPQFIIFKFCMYELLMAKYIA